MKNFINNLSTNAKLILSFAIILVLLAAVIVTAYLGIANATQSEVMLRDVNSKQAIQLQALRSSMNFNMWKLHEILLSTDRSEQEAADKEIQERSQELDAIIVLLTPLDEDPGYQSELQELKKDLADYRQKREQIIALIYAGKLDEAIQLSRQYEAEEYYEKIRILAVQMGDEAIAKTDQQLAADQQTAKTSTLVMVVIGAIALLLSVALVVILNQTIANPLTGISKVAEQISGGDLTVTLPEEQRRDEIGVLTRAFRQMVETLRRSTADISQAVGLLGSSASEILAATTQVASGTVESATAINETTTTVEEVRQAAQLSAQKAQNVSDNAQRVTQTAQNGQKAVEETAAAIDHIRQQMETIAQTVVRLSEQSQSIGGIIASVTDLADQSNLLAVNAAIEAAKAGEQGKGFAVVAQEIKSLAEQSKQATAQVRSILSDVQKATSNAVMATEQGSKAVESGVKQATQAGEAIRVLDDTSGEALQSATQIVASSHQQVVGMDQIGVAMENINQAGAQNAASMRQMETAAQDLHQLGQKLKDLVDQFKV
jgi:methyl-accepting chemotaxis protein